eukprot:TRINITY_DN5372_c0_g1_i2.p1 TRINITY_DN5372_c0_g1~~TRINITY_DN5372_c0_g1_i2.p1  ORF type:complete len:483 (-),score=115.71 TRINITY_DN5372_c0_g1_i2:73-1326(-)
MATAEGLKMNVFYCEVQILPRLPFNNNNSSSSSSSSLLPHVTIGIGASGLNLTREIGTVGNSCAFRSKGSLLTSHVDEDVIQSSDEEDDDDENIDGNNRRSRYSSVLFGKSCSIGDAIGCGLICSVAGKIQLFFTRNDTFLGFASDEVSRDLSLDSAFVYVSLHRAGECASVNMNGPFRFNLDDDFLFNVQWENQVKPALGNFRPSKEEVHDLVQNYFLANGYEKAWLKMSRAQYPCRGLAVLADVRSAIQSKKIAEAKQLLEKVQPGFLVAHPVVSCALDCQEFVEFLRAGDFVSALSFASAQLSRYQGVPGCKAMVENAVCLVAYKVDDPSLPQFVHQAMDASRVISLADFVIEVLSKQPNVMMKIVQRSSLSAASPNGQHQAASLEDLMSQEIKATQAQLQSHGNLGLQSFANH